MFRLDSDYFEDEFARTQAGEKYSNGIAESLNNRAKNLKRSC